MTSPATVPTLEDRAGQLADLGWTGREAEWIALVALHSGVFTRAQWCYFFGDTHREPARRFVRALIEKKAGAEDERAIFPGGGRAVHITHKPIYRALGIENVKHRRGMKETSTQVLMRRLLSLDYLIERPTLGWLPTEDEKVQRFEALGIDRGTLPYRKYGSVGKPQQPRYFALKLPIAVDDQAATFVYVDPGQTTDSELRAWGVAHARLWAALRARTFAVQVGRRGRGRRGGRPRRALAQILDPGRRRHGRRQPHRADPGRPGHPLGNRSPERGDERRQSVLAWRVGRIRERRGSAHGAASTPRRHTHQNEGARGD